MFWRVSTFLAVLLCASAALAGKVRTWTNIDGKTMEAEFVRELDGEVTFLKAGKLVVIKLEKLSEKDRQAVKDLAAGKEPEDEDPFTTPAAKPDERPAESTGEKPEETKPADKSSKPSRPVAIQTRTWTDRFGNKSTGKFVRVDGNDVVINRGTRVITVVFGNLSDGDQEYVRNVLISQGKEDAIPSATLPSGPAGVGGAPGMPAPGIPGAAGRFPRGQGQNPGTVPPFAPPPGFGETGKKAEPGAPMGTGMGVGIGGPPGIRPPISTGLAPGGGGFGPGAGAIGGPMGTSDPGGMIGAAGLAGPGGSMPGPGSMPAASLPPTIGGSPGMTGGGMMGPAAGMTAGMGPGMGTGMSPSGMGGAGMGSMPRMPSMEPASIPPLGPQNFPSIHMEEVYECSKCRAQLTKLEAAGSTCPRCNTTWGYKQDELGRKTMTAAGRTQMTSAGGIIVVFVLLGLVVFFALFIGIIVAVVKAATATRSPPPIPQQRYY